MLRRDLLSAIVMLLIAAPIASAADNGGWTRGADKAKSKSPTLAIVATAEASAMQDSTIPVAEAQAESTDEGTSRVLPDAPNPSSSAPTEIVPDSAASPSSPDALPEGAYIEGVDGEYLEPHAVPRADGAPDCGPLCRLQSAPFVVPYPSGLSAGFEAVIAKPYFAVSSAAGVGGAIASVPEKWEFDMAPRAWLGYTLPGGMGGRFRYWQFDHRSLPQTIAFPGSQQLLQSRLALQTFDFEWTQRGQLSRLVFNFAAGLRYATIAHAAHNQLTLITAPPFETSRSSFVQEFHGGGPTLALEMWRPFLERFAFYGITRGSILFGWRSELADSRIPGSSFTVRSRNESLVPIGELQLGMQWSEALGPGVFFARTGIEGQVWGDAGNITAGSSTSGQIFTPSNLGFFGVTVATGFAW
ncbi:MAG: hypothetical protein K2Y37_21505 [Pirellulales bacterium]|nr:hypothetical protein [Pirellulales bacterium]